MSCQLYLESVALQLELIQEGLRGLEIRVYGRKK